VQIIKWRQIICSNYLGKSWYKAEMKSGKTAVRNEIEAQLSGHFELFIKGRNFLFQ
jgi:hypothetical protein